MKLDREHKTAHPRTQPELQQAATKTAQAVADTFPELVAIVILAIPGPETMFAISSNAGTTLDAAALLCWASERLREREGN